MRSPRPHGPSSGRNLLGSAHSRLVTPIVFPEVLWRLLCCVPHQRQKCLCHPRSRTGSFNLEKLKVTSFVCVFVPAGQKILHHRSDVLETVVLINPSDEAVSTEVSIQLRSISGRSSHSGQDQLGQMSGERHRRDKFSFLDASLPLVTGWFSAVRHMASGAVLPGTCHLLAGSLGQVVYCLFVSVSTCA